MKVSSLIEYLQKYLKEVGDVDLDVEFAGAPKTPPPTQSTKEMLDWNQLLQEWTKKNDEKNNPKYSYSKNPYINDDDYILRKKKWSDELYNDYIQNDLD